MKDIAKEFTDIDQEFAEIRNFVDLKNVVQGFKSRLGRSNSDLSGINKENHISMANRFNRLTITSPKRESTDIQEAPDSQGFISKIVNDISLTHTNCN